MTGTQDGHLDFHTAHELWFFLFSPIYLSTSLTKEVVGVLDVASVTTTVGKVEVVGGMAGLRVRTR